MGLLEWARPLVRLLAWPSIWSVLVPNCSGNSCTGSSGRSHHVLTDAPVRCVVGVNRLSSIIIVCSANLHPVRAIHVVNTHIVFGVLSMKSESKATASKNSKKKSPSRRSSTQRKSTAQASAHADQNTKSEDSMFGHGDQIGTTFAKGLDLAEAGLSLGLTLINRFGTMMQDSVLEKFSGVMGAATASSQESAPSSSRSHDSTVPGPSPEHPEGIEPQDPAYYIANRLPLTPGQPAHVSFSINNDSMDAAKNVKLKVDGFIGSTQGQVFPCKGFTVSPGTKTIEPMDFEKFILKGVIPAGLPPDIYHGRIVVMSEQAIEIPVKLLVTSAT